MSQWQGDPGRKPGKPAAGSGFNNTPANPLRGRQPSGRPMPSTPSSEALKRLQYLNQGLDESDENFVQESDATQLRTGQPQANVRAPQKPGQARVPQPQQTQQQPQQPFQQAQSAYSEDNNATSGENTGRIDLSKRIVAVIIDFLACFMASYLVMLIPFVSRFVDTPTLIMLFFLVRDFPFEGRGIGKNVMGLQVVDRETGRPCNLLQSVKRNIILIAPSAAAFVIQLVTRFMPINAVIHFVTGIVNGVGCLYCLFVLPLECYRAYSRVDGMRIGDEIAGTEIIEANMDFSKPLPRE